MPWQKTIVSAALIIGISVQNKKQLTNPTAITTGNATMDETSIPYGQYTKSDLYYLAKSVNDNCRTDQFVTVAGRWECQHSCEILVSHDFVVSGSLDGLVKDESNEEGAESSSSSNNAKEVVKENELGWQEVRRKEQCEKACEHHYCCFDTGGQGVGRRI